MELVDNFHLKMLSLRIRYLYEQSIGTILYNVVLLTLVNALLWSELPRTTRLEGWLIIFGIAGLRYIHAKQIIKKNLWDNIAFVKKQVFYYTLLVFLGGAAWAAIFILYIQHLETPGKFFMLLVLAGVSAAAIVPLSSFARIYAVYVIPMLIVPAVFFSFGPQQNIEAASVTGLYLIVQLVTAQRSCRLTCRSIRLQIEKDNLIEALSEKNKRIQALLQLDELTQIPNRHFLFETLEHEFHRAQREHTYLTLFMIDIDSFKLYNDHYGHVRGDKALHQVAQILQQTLQRAGDFVARYGGEEFFAILPNTQKTSAITMAQRIISNIKEANIEHVYSGITPHLSVSIGGVVLQPSDILSTDNAIIEADKALYQAKEQGRDRFVIYNDSELN